MFQSTTYAPVGCCIYCGSHQWSQQQTRKLGDEHIIPEGLGGRMVLPECSCQSCELETSRVELECLRGSFYAARVQKRLGKKKKRAPVYLPLKIQNNGRINLKSIPIEKYPGLIVTLVFDKPDVLLDILPTSKELSGGVAIGILPTFGERLKEHLAQGTVTFESPRKAATNHALGRMLAKIAHSYATAELGLDGFVPFLQQNILGKDLHYLSHYVGGTREIPLRSVEHYKLELKTVRSQAGEPYLMVTIRFLSDVQGMPEYWVVVGKQHQSIDVVYQ